MRPTIFVVHPSMLVWCPDDGVWLNPGSYTMPIFNKGSDWLGDPYQHPTGQRLFGARKVTPGGDAGSQRMHNHTDLFYFSPLCNNVHVSSNCMLETLGTLYHPTGQRLFGARKVTPTVGRMC